MKAQRGREDEVIELAGAEPVGALAARLLQALPAWKGRPCVFVAQSERRAEKLVAILRALSPSLRMAIFPAWDTLPYDRVAPSRAAMGQRASLLNWLMDRASLPDLVLATPMAIIRRVPPRGVWTATRAEFHVGERIDPEVVGRHLRRIGYIFDERVDTPGEVALRANVVDLFPAAAPLPCRIEHEEGRIRAIHSYDPLTQRSEVETATLLVDPASEFIPPPEADDDAIDAAHSAGSLSDFHPSLETLFDYVAKVPVVLDDGAQERANDFFEAIAEAYVSRKDAPLAAPLARPQGAAPPDREYLRAEEWERHVRQRLVARIGPPREEERVPRFVRERQARGALADFIAHRRCEGARLLLCGTSERNSRRLAAVAAGALGAAKRRTADRDIDRLDDWQAVRAASPGSLHRMVLPIDAGFQLPDDKIVVVAAGDLFGGEAAEARSGQQRPPSTSVAETAFRLGDAVVHLDHGMGILEGLEEIETGAGRVDTLMLRYADDARLKVQVDQIGEVWRYGPASGSRAGSLSLDRLHGDGWARRRARLEAEIRSTAVRMVDLARQRNESVAPKLVAPPRDLERFASRFPYSLTPDQTLAVEAVLADLASGRPMDRLVCADVGFGKTEVALRAAAAAVFSGKQVAVIAPTTVLVRQHVRTFRRRFAPFGIEVAHLSRLVKPAEARAVKEGLASGEIRLVVGTHALVGKGVKFADLGLLVIDEEHRFGARDKSKLRARAKDGHVLTLTATPIPRTLQSALIGLQELSVIATPPSRRQPVRTMRATFDTGVVRNALMRERRRGGQSFVVCPRIEDIAPMAERLAKIVPELRVVTAHGKMPTDEMDEAMVGFAEGEGDVLLATNIIESGLDVPRANTILICRADLFGLAQLHQLRGRVGRGARRGFAWLMVDHDSKLGAATEKRLRSLEELDRLGAGLTVSTRDLDMRGAGDLLGEDQAGHVKRLGLGLYQHLLSRALAEARGETVDDWSPTVHVDGEGRIPQDYVSAEEMRINLYARLAALRDLDEVAAFEDEMRDRFGPIPESVAQLLRQAGLRTLCFEAGILKLEVGEKAIAATPRSPPSAEAIEGVRTADARPEWRGGRFILHHESADPGERADLALALLEQLLSRS